MGLWKSPLLDIPPVTPRTKIPLGIWTPTTVVSGRPTVVVGTLFLFTVGRCRCRSFTLVAFRLLDLRVRRGFPVPVRGVGDTLVPGPRTVPGVCRLDVSHRDFPREGPLSSAHVRRNERATQVPRGMEKKDPEVRLLLTTERRFRVSL